MAHKTLIDGTAYDTKGGRCLVDGTGYSIKKGRTLVDGTGYDIVFDQLCTVTITGTGTATGYYTYVEIDGVTYETAATIQVPIGTTMLASGFYQSSGPNKGCGGVFLNSTAVATGTQGQNTFNYTITGDITVEFEMFSGSPTVRYGYVKIKDQYNGPSAP